MCSCVRHSMWSNSIRKLLDKSFLLRLGRRLWNHLSINGQSLTLLTLLTVSCFVWWISHLCCQVNHSYRQFMPSSPARERDAGCLLRVTGTPLVVSEEICIFGWHFSIHWTVWERIHFIKFMWQGLIVLESISKGTRTLKFTHLKNGMTPYIWDSDMIYGAYFLTTICPLHQNRNHTSPRSVRSAPPLFICAPH